MKRALKWAPIALIAGSLTASCTQEEGGKTHTALAPTESSSPKPSPTGRITTASGATLYIDRVLVSGGGAALCPADNPQCTLPQGGGGGTDIWMRAEGNPPTEGDFSGVYLTNSVGRVLKRMTLGPPPTYSIDVHWSNTPRFLVLFDFTGGRKGLVLHWPGNKPISLDAFIQCDPREVSNCP